MPKYTLTQLAVDHSQYFRGYGGPVDSMPVTGETTWGQVKDWLKIDAFDGQDLDSLALEFAVSNFIDTIKWGDDFVIFSHLLKPSDVEDGDKYEWPNLYIGIVEDEEDD